MFICLYFSFSRSEDLLECPPAHYQCPGHGLCLPVLTRCNGVYDCPGRQDEVSHIYTTMYKSVLSVCTVMPRPVSARADALQWRVRLSGPPGRGKTQIPYCLLACSVIPVFLYGR